MHGFHNNGNTCYFNTAIQCVLHIPKLSEYIIENTPVKEQCVFTSAYRELVKLYFQSEHILKIDILPLLLAFCETFPRFKTMQQHDAQEALFCVLSLLENAYPCIKKMVYGEREQHTVWPLGKKSVKEPFSMLLLHGKDGTSVNELIKESEDWHTLTDYVDDAGKKHHVATTRTGIITYPPVLFVSFDKKVRVTADLHLDRYALRGSIIHVGNHSGGHYMSMMKRNNDWILQDDTTLTLTDFPVTHDHHVLMYSLKNPPS